MLLKKDLLKSVDEQYRPMLKEVNIPDFTKCIAQFSGLHISKVADSAIQDYLIKWAKNKYHFYKLLGNKLRYDTDIQYEDDNQESRRADLLELAKEYPAYSLWIYEFTEVSNNKIEELDLSYSFKSTVKELFPKHSIIGMSLTHFFKNYLSAPDELVTKIGRVFENKEIEANYTISIDPVDMMLASENPYNWTSCYRLSEGCHGDGTLAAMLDTNSLITYIWNKEGDFSLYGNYMFKSIRYKKIRQYVSISPSMNSIHFNIAYPGKSYLNSFERLLRSKVEDLVDKNATWINNSRCLPCYMSECDRKYKYGYGEFGKEYIYIRKFSKEEKWETYDEEIICPCGCGNYLYGSEAIDELGNEVQYNDDGFTSENEYTRHYCEIIDEYCDAYNGDCSECSAYNRENAVCELDEEHYCEGDTDVAEDDNLFDPYESNVIHCSPEFCKSCPFYKLHNQESNDDLIEEMKIAEGVGQED